LCVLRIVGAVLCRYGGGKEKDNTAKCDKRCVVWVGRVSRHGKIRGGVALLFEWVWKVLVRK